MTSTCIFCKRGLIEHSPKEALSCFENIIRGENIDCVLKISNKMAVASSACGTDDQLNEKIHRDAPNGVSNNY